MTISLVNDSQKYSQIATAFQERHDEILSPFNIVIAVSSWRGESVESFSITASRTGSEIKVSIGLSEVHAFRYALNALLKWIGSTDSTPLNLIDGPAFRIRGVVEGFYGQPWTHQQRLRGIEFFGDFGMNTYFLAPKDDPLQRFNWRSPFPNEFLTQAKELILQGKKHGVDFVACVSPGLSVKYSDSKDVAAVVFRFTQLLELGATHFGMLWDDIAWELQHQEDIEKYASTAEAHADFTNKVFDQLIAINNNVQLTACPMQYSGRGNEPYLIDLGRKLRARVNLMWTGRQICSEYLDISDAVIFERSALRPALYWDNFPVNDGSMQANLYIGPVRGREKGLEKYSYGLLSNPMLQFESSLIPLATIGDYLWNSTAYDPACSWEDALIRLFPNVNERACLRHFLRNSLGSNVGGDPAPDLRKIFHAGVSAWRSGNMNQSADIFETESLVIAANYKDLTSESFSHAGLIEEILPWLAKYKVGGEVLFGLGQSLRECTFDSERRIIVGPANVSQQLKSLLEKLKSTPKNLFGDQIEGPLNELIAELKTFS